MSQFASTEDLRSIDDVRLLRQFEPIARYDRGERFFPMPVERYVRQCSLWMWEPGRGSRPLYSQGEVTLDDLADLTRDDPAAAYFLRFEPLAPAPDGAGPPPPTPGRRPSDRRAARASRGRLARVGLLARIVDAVNTIVLLARERVPAGRASTIARVYAHLLAQDPRHLYYGRVVRQGGWIVLQYWLFYLFDDWRSGFSGANDHDADWEMVAVYLGESASGDVSPEWVAASRHDEPGTNLIRRWHDPSIEKVGDHAVIYLGAGSHAGYYAAGEYLSEIELSFLRPVSVLANHWRQVWHERLRQYRGSAEPAESPAPSGLFRVPFVDHARGDGVSIGPDQEQAWSEPVLLDPTPGWVSRYRGLWGLYQRDPFSAEDAPAGPMYDRNGAPRRAWYDPVGWAGLDRVPTWAEALAIVEAELSELSPVEQLRERIDAKTREIKRLYVELVSAEGHRHLRPVQASHQSQIAELSREVARLGAQAASDQARREALERYAERLRCERHVPVLRPTSAAPQPTRPDESKVRHVAEVWAAASVGVLLLTIAALALFARDWMIPGALTFLGGSTLVEAILRGRITQIVGRVTIWLALAAALVLVYQFFWWIVFVAVLLTGGYVLWDNLRELWKG
jgi:hypothetical protein